MADYPASIYTPRVVENLPGESFDALQTKTCFAEDVNNPNNEIVAIETELGLEPKGTYGDVAERLDALEAGSVPPGGDPTGVVYLDDVGTPKVDADLLSYDETANVLTVGGAEDGSPDASTRLRVKDGNIELDNSHGILISDTGGTRRAVLALTDEDNLDMSNEIYGGNFRLQAGETGEIQFHFQGGGPSLRGHIEDEGQLHLNGDITIGEGDNAFNIDPSDITAPRSMKAPDNDGIIARADFTITEESGSVAPDTYQTNSSPKTLMVNVGVDFSGATGSDMYFFVEDSMGTRYTGLIGYAGASPTGEKETKAITFCIPPGAEWGIINYGTDLVDIGWCYFTYL